MLPPVLEFQITSQAGKCKDRHSIIDSDRTPQNPRFFPNTDLRARFNFNQIKILKFSPDYARKIRSKIMFFMKADDPNNLVDVCLQFKKQYNVMILNFAGLIGDTL